MLGPRRAGPVEQLHRPLQRGRAGGLRRCPGAAQYPYRAARTRGRPLPVVGERLPLQVPEGLVRCRSSDSRLRAACTQPTTTSVSSTSGRSSSGRAGPQVPDATPGRAGVPPGEQGLGVPGGGHRPAGLLEPVAGAAPVGGHLGGRFTAPGGQHVATPACSALAARRTECRGRCPRAARAAADTASCGGRLDQVGRRAARAARRPHRRRGRRTLPARPPPAAARRRQVRRRPRGCPLTDRTRPSSICATPAGTPAGTSSGGATSRAAATSCSVKNGLPSPRRTTSATTTSAGPRPTSAATSAARASGERPRSPSHARQPRRSSKPVQHGSSGGELLAAAGNDKRGSGRQRPRTRKVSRSSVPGSAQCRSSTTSAVRRSVPSAASRSRTAANSRVRRPTGPGSRAARRTGLGGGRPPVAARRERTGPGPGPGRGRPTGRPAGERIGHRPEGQRLRQRKTGTGQHQHVRGGTHGLGDQPGLADPGVPGHHRDLCRHPGRRAAPDRGVPARRGGRRTRPRHVLR